ncbi:MAG: thiamine diphosphokinase [Eggerthellaceae bacterium]|nr:thiamine diphosphokinase [Eggerthellaceae bacterium]
MEALLLTKGREDAMSSCALVGSVDFNAGHFLAQSFDSVVAADAGYERLREVGAVCDRVVGDFDSLGFVPDHPAIERHPVRKDESDIELALRWAAAEGFDTLVVYGCLAGRLDFTYAVLQLLAQYAQAGFQVFGIGTDCAVAALCGGRRDSLSFSGRACGTASVFAASGKARGVCEEGLLYPLADATLADTEPLGVSNEFTGRPARISVGEGILLVFFPLDAWDAMLP